MRREPDLISREDRPGERERRLTALHRDLALKATGKPCPGCRERAWHAGGRGCQCSRVPDLVARCDRAGAAARQHREETRR